MTEELSVFQVVEQGSTRGRSEQALLGLRSVGKVGSSKYIIYSWILRGSGQAKFCYPPSNQERYSWREREKERHTHTFVVYVHPGSHQCESGSSSHQFWQIRNMESIVKDNLQEQEHCSQICKNC